MTAEPISSGTADSSTTDSSQTDKETDPFKKYQDIRHQDFGEIVFRKTKATQEES